MHRIRMSFKFLIWLLKKALWVPILMVAYLHMFIDSWKDECRNEFGLALFYYLLTVLCSMVGGVVGMLMVYGDEPTKSQVQSSLLTSCYLATGLFVFVILLASYDKFIEEYEESFNKLKE